MTGSTITYTNITKHIEDLKLGFMDNTGVTTVRNNIIKHLQTSSKTNVKKFLFFYNKELKCKPIDMYISNDLEILTKLEIYVFSNL